MISCQLGLSDCRLRQVWQIDLQVTQALFPDTYKDKLELRTYLCTAPAFFPVTRVINPFSHDGIDEAQNYFADRILTHDLFQKCNLL